MPIVLILIALLTLVPTHATDNNPDGDQTQHAGEGDGGNENNSSSVSAGGINYSNKGLRIGLIWSDTGKLVPGYLVYDFIYESSRDFEFFKNAKDAEDQIWLDNVTGVNTQWVFGEKLAIPKGDTPFLYKGTVEEWFPDLGVWSGSNTVFTSWMKAESPRKGTSNAVYYILGELYKIKK